MAKTSILKSSFHLYRFPHLGAIAILVLTLSSCIRKTEGCMDVLALNFRADIDLSCEDCCTYPDLNLSVTHAVGDTTLNYNDTIQFEGNAFRILSVSFYAQNFKLANTEDTVNVSDKITLTDRDHNQTIITDDILLISRNTLSSSYTIGKFPVSGNFQTFQFLLGLSDETTNIAPSSLSSTHALSSELGLYELPDSNYVTTQIQLLNTNQNDTLLFNIQTNKAITLTYPMSINRGTNTTIPLKIDYLEWLKGINFADNYQLMEQVISNNLVNGFTIIE